MQACIKSQIFLFPSSIVACHPQSFRKLLERPGAINRSQRFHEKLHNYSKIFIAQDSDLLFPSWCGEGCDSRSPHSACASVGAEGRRAADGLNTALESPWTRDAQRFLSGLRVKLREKKRLELREHEAKRSGPLNPVVAESIGPRGREQSPNKHRRQ